MLSGLAADADLRGQRIDVSWAWTGLEPRPAFLLVRRRRAHPTGPGDGYPVLDVGELFRGPDEPWERVSRVRYLAGGSGAEGGLVQAELAFFHDAPGASQPATVDVAIHDPVAGATVSARIEGVSGTRRTLPDPGPWGLVEALEILRTEGDGPASSAGVVTVSHDHADGTTPSRLRWEPAGGPSVEAEFDSAELVQTRADVRAHTQRELLAAWRRRVRLDGWDLATALSAPEDARDDALLDDGHLTLHEDFSEDTGDWTRAVRVCDLRAAPEETSYYTVFRDDPSAPGSWATERGWRVHAAATARYGLADRLYGLLPSTHQYHDEPTAQARGRGQLRRYVQVFGVALDHLRSGAEALRTRHDLAEVRGDLLPALGDWIGWSTDRSARLPTQRSDILMAPDVYATVGTLPNVVALATRVTGWPCAAKEFVHNVFLTNAPEAVEVRELWEMAHDGTDFGAPVRLTATGAFDGRPAAVAEPGGRTWLFWHSNRSGRWEIWTRVADGGEATAPAPLFDGADEGPPTTHADLSPAPIRFPQAGAERLWLFWESDREGAWDVWGRVHDGTRWGTPFRVTDHPAADRRPAAARGPAGTLWVFWESERRGPTGIWSRVHDGAAWGPVVRVTDGPGRDREPAAALDADGLLWLVWRRDEADRSRLYARTFDGHAWGPASPLEDGPWRDESPAVVARGAELWLVWHSDRTGRWELWGRVREGTRWGDPFPITRRADRDKEPAAVPDGTDLRIFWRSERPATEHRSRTVDTTDAGLLEQRGLVGDRLHYTYDTARTDTDWYARDVVGLYLTPPPGTPTTVVDEVLDRARAYLEPFCPATVRLVLVPARAPRTTDFSTDGIEGDGPLVDAFEDEIE